MSISNLPMVIPSKKAWNDGRIIGQKRPLLPKHVWATRVRLDLATAIPIRRVRVLRLLTILLVVARLTHGQ